MGVIFLSNWRPLAIFFFRGLKVTIFLSMPKFFSFSFSCVTCLTAKGLVYIFCISLDCISYKFLLVLIKRTCKKSSKKLHCGTPQCWWWQQLYESNKVPILKNCSCWGQLELGFWQNKGRWGHIFASYVDKFSSDPVTTGGCTITTYTFIR